jgi:hypothetical protein
MPAFRQIVSELRPQGRLNAGPAPKSLSLEPVAQGATAIVDEELQRRHQEALVNGRTALNELDMRLIHNPETGAARLTGRAAIGVGKVIAEEFDKRVSEISDGMPDRSRQAFMALAQAGVRRLRSGPAATSCASPPLRESRTSWSECSLQSSARSVRRRCRRAMPTRPSSTRGKAIAEINTGTGMITEHWRGRGASQEFINAKVAEYTSAAHEAVIKNMQLARPGCGDGVFQGAPESYQPASVG